jgi:hypothetical protein
MKYEKKYFPAEREREMEYTILTDVFNSCCSSGQDIEIIAT